MCSSRTCTGLPGQISSDRIGDAGFGGIGRGEADGPHQAGVQVLQHVTDVTIDAHTAAFASMPHLGVFNRNTPIFGHSCAQGGTFRRTLLHILLFHLLGRPHAKSHDGSVMALGRCVEPAFHGRQGGQDDAQGLFTLSGIVPVSI